MSPPDILLRITERRRQRIAEAGGADAAGWPEGAPHTPADNAFLGRLRAMRRDPAIIAEVRDGEVRLYDVEPERFGLRRVAQEELAGGTPDENAAALRRVFAGEGGATGALAEVTALNAGAALYVGGLAETLEQGVETARATLASGAAERKLEELRSFSVGAAG